VYFEDMMHLCPEKMHNIHMHIQMNCEISGCHSVVAEDAVLLGCDALLSDDLFLTCRRTIMLPSSWQNIPRMVYLKNGGYNIIKNAVTAHPVTWHYIPEDTHFL
jgi:hypothetical protein